MDMELVYLLSRNVNFHTDLLNPHPPLFFSPLSIRLKKKEKFILECNAQCWQKMLEFISQIAQAGSRQLLADNGPGRCVERPVCISTGSTGRRVPIIGALKGEP